MSQSARKLIGSLVILIMMFLYALLATVFAAAKLADSHWAIHLLYFFGTGLLWIIPAMIIIRWMLKPDQD